MRFIPSIAGGAPELKLLSGKINPISFVSATWSHGPGMLRQLSRKQLLWPRFEKRELEDLPACVNSL